MLSLCPTHTQVVDATKSNKFLGVQILESRGIFPQAKWFWIGMAGLVGYVLVFNTLYTLALTYLDREYPNLLHHSPLLASQNDNSN